MCEMCTMPTGMSGAHACRRAHLCTMPTGMSGAHACSQACTPLQVCVSDVQVVQQPPCYVDVQEHVSHKALQMCVCMCVCVCVCVWCSHLQRALVKCETDVLSTDFR
jgi:hypothetical protein